MAQGGRLCLPGLSGSSSCPSQSRLSLAPCSNTHLCWVVKHPLLPWLLLVGAQGLGDEAPQCRAHSLQQPVQPDLHLQGHTRRAERGSQPTQAAQTSQYTTGQSLVLVPQGTTRGMW